MTPPTPGPIRPHRTVPQHPDVYHDEWVEPGDTIQVQGYVISAGHFYFGDILPFSVDPRAKVDEPAALPTSYHTSELSYRSLFPAARGMYLSWLASDRKAPAKLEGDYLMLFVHGLEWRLFVEGRYNRELGCSTVDLLNRYSSHSCCAPLTAWIHWWSHFSGAAVHSVLIEYLIDNGHGFPGPNELKLSLADLAAAGVALKADVAYAMIPLHPEQHRDTSKRLRDPDLKAQFVARFGHQFPDGIVLNMTRATTSAYYSPQFPNLWAAAERARYKQDAWSLIPDIWVANGGFTDLITLWNQIVQEVASPKLKPSTRPVPQPGGLVINQEKLKTLTQETREIQGVLGQRLQDSEEPVPAENQSLPKGPRSCVAVSACASSGMPQLGSQYKAILRDLVQIPQWSRMEFEALARKHRLMPYAIYQDVNAWTVEVCKDHLLDGTDVIQVNQTLITHIHL